VLFLEATGLKVLGGIFVVKLIALKEDKVDHFCVSLVFASPYSGADSTKVILQAVASHKLFLHKTLRSTIPTKKVMSATMNEIL